ncbi:periplasmic binding protein/LacI transcriptional regulator [Petrotoga mobilis SJ95]|uniref:Periplasmic binding protein/LacI transcriptional regulator n=1 Tax=Petrotoga mobilis (strain DSM 10674 / SJ95) TaxID=403833 RepID=A9BGQ4_PETMO|nr:MULTISPECIES: ABC transporter substrate-binding protein [Petrotoga]ABX32294.1 periplasmic binding protein/LacI transcriptional regulator [Petrotoga mobilis SJ95]
MKKGLTVLLLVTVLLSFSLIGFGQTSFFDISKANPPKAIQSSDMTIFFIVKASENEFWQIVLDGAQKAANHFGVEFIHQEATSESEVSRQVSILETAISTNPDAIVLAPTVADALVPGIERAMDSGIPVIIIDSMANTDNYVSFLGSDNYTIGQRSADELAKALEEKNGSPSGKVAAITYMSGVGSLEARISGFLDRIEEAYPDIEVVSVRDAMGQVGNTINITLDLLTAYPDLDGLYANNQMTGDDMVRALDMQGRNDLAAVAVDASAQEIWGLENGYLDSVLVQQPWVMGYAGVAYAVMARNGVPLAKNVDTGILVITPESLASGEADAAINPFEYYKDW